MSTEAILIFAGVMMMSNLIAAIALLVQEHRRNYWTQKWRYEPGNYPYDWEYEKFVDLVNESYQK